MRKKVLLGIGCTLCSVVVMAFVHLSRPKNAVQKLVFEYGEPININLIDIVDESYHSDVQDFWVDKTSLVFMDNLEYPETGIYTLPVSYKINQESFLEEIIVEISDTINPTFLHSVEQLEFTLGSVSSDYDFLSHFDIDDVSNVTVDLNLNDVNFEVVDSYTGLVQAVDDHGNETIKAFTIIIKDVFLTLEERDAMSCSGTPESLKEPFSVNDIIVVNKKHPLPRDYAPGEDSQAQRQVLLLIDEMRTLGYDIDSSYSGYRSFDYQSQLYNNYVSSYGKEEADRFSAKPGYSEHQTGLAFDLRHKDGSLVESDNEVEWIKHHAHNYGFIVRYLEEAESITGYLYEPWHLRYVGDAATDIYNSELTLEAYLGVFGGDYCD